MTGRLVIVSHRAPLLPGTKAASLPALAGIDFDDLNAPPTLWFGWSGRISQDATAVTSVRRARSLTCVGIDLNPNQYDGHLNGFANSTLWPLFHDLPERIRFNPDDLAVYRAVNGMLASRLVPMLRPDDQLWIHDYHLIPLGWMLRQSGVHAPLGFYLHVPFPAAQGLLTVPWRRKLAEDLAAYDFIGFQTRRDLENFHEFMRRVRPTGVARRIAGGLAQLPMAEVLPVGIATRTTMASAASLDTGEQAIRFSHCLRNRQIIIGADRLDYTKGLIERFCGYERLLAETPDLHRKVCFVQVTAPSRSLVPGYLELRTEQKAAAQRINKRFAGPGWMPVYDVYGSLGADALTSLFRTSRVGLMTPIRDGVNLAAKEFVAAQHPGDPGVLVLSRFAGAADLLTDALLVDPSDPGQIAQALRTALAMPLGERQDRWRRMIVKLLHNDALHWHHSFLSGLSQAYRLSMARESAGGQPASSFIDVTPIPPKQGQHRRHRGFSEMLAGEPALHPHSSLPWPDPAS
jgi:trehalose 6-phosphate synthase